MKVVAFNSSPRTGKGNTALILNPFLEGMKEAGAEVEFFYTKKLNIGPCQSDFSCWLKTPGKCFLQDDMQMLLPKLVDADIVVFATPLYVDGVSGPMKNLFDRMIPLVQPFIELRDGHCRHLRLEGSKDSKVVLVSNAGFWEMDNFEPMVAHIKGVCKNMGREFSGALLRPHGPALPVMQKMGKPVDDVFEAAKEAGRQLVEEGEMSSQTLDGVSRELLPLEMYINILNQNFQAVLGKVA